MRLLGTVLAHQEAAELLGLVDLPADAFTGPFRRLYETWRRACGSGNVIPSPKVIVLEANPETEGQRQRMIGFIKKVIDQADGPETVNYYIDKLLEFYRQKRLADLSTRIREHLRNKHSAASTLAEIYDELFTIESIGQGQWSFAHLSDGSQSMLAEAARGVSGQNYVATGISELDALTNGGIARGTISLWAGRPGMGKSSVLKSIALRVASAGTPSAYFSLEMPMEQCLQRFVAEIAHVETARLQRPSLLQDEDWKRLNKVPELVKNWPLWIEDTPGMTISQLHNRVRWYVRQKGVQAVFVDYIQLLRLSNGNPAERESDWSAIANGILQMTRELNIAGFYATQLNRDVEKRIDKRPQLSDIRNTGRFENDASYVIGIYCDEYYHREESTRPNIIDLTLLKHRNGPQGQVELFFDRPYQAVRELTTSIDASLKELDDDALKELDAF